MTNSPIFKIVLSVLVSVGIILAIGLLPAKTTSNSAQTDPESAMKAQVLPEAGFQTKIILGDSVIKLVEAGVIDADKFTALYESRGGLPEEFKNIFTKPENRPILLTDKNANIYLNFLWALGLANYMDVNKQSPVVGVDLANFASTGGWNLGRADNGAEYFNKFEIVKLSPEQEALVKKIGENTFRPCCDNSTFFQDCNHGSALLAVLELGAKQGLSESQLFKEALHFNSFWFPGTYLETALYFKNVKNTNWKNVDPKEILSAQYSSSSGFRDNVHKTMQELGLVPKEVNAGSCGS